MIERIEGLPAGVVGLRATGEVTKQDYELAVVPLFDALRAEGEPIRLLFHFQRTSAVSPPVRLGRT
ncbi:MAG: hypothetical protein ACI84E_000336 [Planctomycetota bacterium]|jgi:hypothetical protein